MARKTSKFLAAIVGAQQSGKSFYTSRLAKTYTDKNYSVIVYNWSGQQKDFADFFIGTFLNPAETATIRDTVKKKLLYTDGDMLFHAKDASGKVLKEPDGTFKIFSLKFFNKDFFGKGVRFLSGDDTEQFFSNCEKYISNALLVIDDAKNIVSHGLHAEGLKLTRRLNHSGSNHISTAYQVKGIDTVFIFHSFDDIKSHIISSLNYIVMFKTTSAPNTYGYENERAAAEIAANYKILETAEKYTYLEVVFSEPN